MKKFIYIIIASALMVSCKDYSIGLQPSDKEPPGPVSDVSVTNKPGAAVIHYTLPSDEDLSYVKAVYYRNGVMAEARASRYVDSLMVEGFGDTNEQKIELVAVDQSKNESSVVTTEVQPLTPPVQTIANTISMIEDFGGVTTNWTNELNSEVALVFLVADSTKTEWFELDSYYSKTTDGKFSIRGMPVFEFDFGVYVKDRWDNISDTVFYTLTPLFETELDKDLFAGVALPGDQGDAFGWVLTNAWDGRTGNQGYSSPGGTGVWPHSITIDLGIEAKLSRLRIIQRTGNNFEFAEGNLRKFEIWGCTDLNPDGSFDGWTLMGDFESIKPSGLPFGSVSEEDLFVARNGEDFPFDPTLDKVRFIRFVVKQTWAGGDNFQLTEIFVYGDNREQTEE